MMMIIRVMNVAPWECLPIAILMQILATCACTTIIGLSKALQQQNFQFILFDGEIFCEGESIQESAVGKMLWPLS